MNQRSLFKLFTMFLLLGFQVQAQVSIISIPVQAFNLTPQALLNVNIMSNDEEKQVQLVTRLLNSSNQVLLTVQSRLFTLRKGLNTAGDNPREVMQADFSSQQQAAYLRSTHNLPSGRYKICAVLVDQRNPGETGDFCEEFDADFNQYLYLVNPFDRDTVDSKHPVLSWTHSEPFSILSQGEYYRMVVAEMSKDQSAEEAIVVNTPCMVKNYLKEHQLNYPFDAKELKENGKYAWQVQKLSDGVVINKTEAWTFYVRGLHERLGTKYVTLKQQLDGSFYQADNGIVYFKFSEVYKSRGELKFSLKNSKSEPVEIAIKKDKPGDGTQAGTEAALKTTGDNLYELDLNSKKLRPGFYTLEIKNEKNEQFYLKIFLP